jgi:hypothetical protein
MEKLGLRVQLAGLSLPGVVMLINAATGYEFGRLGHVLVVLAAAVVVVCGRLIGDLPEGDVVMED